MPLESRTAADPSDSRSVRRFRFAKEARILKQDDFERVFAQNHEIAGKYLVARVGFGDGMARRLGLKVTKKTFHLAVDRNRAKRLLRESFRLIHPSLSGEAWDLVVIARRRILGVRQQAVQFELEWACRKLGIARRNGGGIREGGDVRKSAGAGGMANAGADSTTGAGSAMNSGAGASGTANAGAGSAINAGAGCAGGAPEVFGNAFGAAQAGALSGGQGGLP